MVIRVLLVDDDALVRSGLQVILSSAEDLTVVGEAADGAEVVEAVRRCRPDVVVMDIRMPQMDGVTATALVRALPDPPAVVVLTTFAADRYVFDSLHAGAAGFLLKDAPPADIVNAVRLVAAGEAMLSPSVTRTLIDRFGDQPAQQRRESARARLAELTDREREVAIAVGSGASNAEIGAQLILSEATVKVHVSRVLAKLQVANRVQVAIVVHDAGLTEG